MSPQPRFRTRFALHARRFAIVVTAAAVALALYQVDPTSVRWLPICPLHELTGWHCPGCGSTRAAHALLHGDVVQALSKNALVVCGAPIALALWTWNRKRTGHAWATAVPARWIWSALLVMAVFAVLRNVPLYPFSLLAPH